MEERVRGGSSRKPVLGGVGGASQLSVAVTNS
jgi:hypothetical protein